MKDPQKVTQGKKNRKSGRDFELKVRKNLESKGWIVAKWMNNVEFNIELQGTPGMTAVQIVPDEVVVGKLIPAKHKFQGIGRPMAIGTGFPDFIAFTTFGGTNILHTEFGEIEGYHCIIGVEVKSNGYLTKEEKEKCKWLLDNHIFSKILIASKGEKRGEIIYKEFENAI